MSNLCDTTGGPTSFGEAVEVWTAKPGFRFFQKGDGPKILQQAWMEQRTGKIEWRDVEIVHEP